MNYIQEVELIPSLKTCFVLLVSVCIPLSIFFGRGMIRQKRRRILDDLDGRLKAIPTPTPSALASTATRYTFETSTPIKEFIAYAAPTSIFILIAFVGFQLVLSILGYSFEDSNYFLRGFYKGGGNEVNSKDIGAIDYQAATALIASAAFIGSYIWSINYLVLRVANFDLTPLDFLRSSIHVLLTSSVAIILRHVTDFGSSFTLATGVVLGLAFVVGYYPSFGVSLLIDKLPKSLKIKRVIADAADIARDLPLDLIDGIDAAIKFRLANYEITDVQNLATENPIKLYISTPYSLFEIIDWISQAQLLLAVGPQKYIYCRNHSVRDIVCLLNLAKISPPSNLLKCIVLNQDATPDEVKIIVSSIENSPHVSRLLKTRQAAISLA